MCAGNETSFDFKNLTSEQWERTRHQIIRRAEAARAQALRDLFSAVLARVAHRSLGRSSLHPRRC
jgi:hypothetical protein